MGFGFNLFVFPALIVISIGLLIYFFVTKSKGAIKIFCGLWAVVILLFIVATITAKFNQPIRLTREQIIGNYRIDKKFYPGKNADWQYEHYRFSITPTDSLYFYLTQRGKDLKVIRSKIKYSSEPPYLWAVVNDASNCKVKLTPTLFRGHNRFYYVFHSDVYGNMFFRKEN